MIGQIKFGLRLHTDVRNGEYPTLREMTPYVNRVENLGFDSIWVHDHVLAAPPVYTIDFLDAQVVLSAVAAATEKIKIGTAVLVLPIRHPVIVAKAIATLDAISGGRVIFGAASGWIQGEFSAMGVSIRARGGRCEEMLKIIKLLWTNDHISFNGRYYQFEDLTVEPKPRQESGPPIWIAGGNTTESNSTTMGSTNADAVLRRIAKYCDGWFPRNYPSATLDIVLNDLKKIRRYAKEEGRDPSCLSIADLYYIYLAEDPDLALHEAKKLYGRYAHRDIEDIKLRGGRQLFGTPEVVAERIAERVRKLSPSHVIFTPLNYEERQLELLVDKVIPRVQEEVGKDSS